MFLCVVAMCPSGMVFIVFANALTLRDGMTVEMSILLNVIGGFLILFSCTILFILKYFFPIDIEVEVVETRKAAKLRKQRKRRLLIQKEALRRSLLLKRMQKKRKGLPQRALPLRIQFWK